MEVTHELILGLTDIDRLSIKCKSCGAEFMLSLNLLSDAKGADESSTNRQVPKKCPSCPRDWSGTAEKLIASTCQFGTVPAGSPESSLGVTASSVTCLNSNPGFAITPKNRTPPCGSSSVWLSVKTQGGFGH